MNALAWLDRHRGTALFLGGAASATLGATYWLARGGAAAFFMSMSALSDPEIADTLAGLPAYHERMETSQTEIQTALTQITDSLETFRGNSERVLDWAPQHSQRLTDAVGGCVLGEPCITYFRGRKTQAGMGCTINAARPQIHLTDGRVFPVTLDRGFDLDGLGTQFDTLEVVFTAPAFLEPGVVGFVVLTVFANCPFASVGGMVERQTFQLLVELRDEN